MKALTACVVAIIAVCSTAVAQLPADVAQFQEQMTGRATSPQGAAKLWFDAVMVYTTRDKAQGTAMITEMTKDKDWEATMSYFVDALNNKAHLFRSYTKGATPDNGYRTDPDKYELVIVGKAHTRPFADYPEGEVVKLSLKSGGAELPRPMFMQRNEDGIYKAREFSSICVDVRPIKTPVDESVPGSEDPYWVMNRFFEGIITYIDGRHRKGREIIASVCDYKEFLPGNLFEYFMQEQPWMFGGYMEGSSPEEDYAFDRDKWRLAYAEPIKSVAPGKQTRASLKHSGAGMPKPIYLRVDERGQYRIREYGNVYSSCRKPGKRQLDASIPQSKDPYWVMTRFFEGILLYTAGDREKGKQTIASVSERKEFIRGNLLEYFMRTRPWMFGGYMKGTSHADGYEFSRDKWQLEYAEPIKRVEPGRATRACLKHSGADLPKPIYLSVDERGEYRISNYDNVYSSVRPPKPPEVLDDDVAQSTGVEWVFRHWLQGILSYCAGQTDTGLAQMLSVMKDKDASVRAFHGTLTAEKCFIWRSYVKGTSVDDAYEIDDLAAAQVDVYFQTPLKPGAERATLFVRSTGGVLPRPLKLVADSRGQWRISEFSSLCVGLSKVPRGPQVFGDDIPQSTEPMWVVRHWLQGILQYCAGQKEQGKARMFSVMKNPTLQYLESYGALKPEKSYIWRSYVKGTSVDDGYKVADLEGFQADMYYQIEPAATDTKRTLFVRSTGGVTPRPVKLEKDDRGQWRITDEYSSLCVGLSKVPKPPLVWKDDVPQSTDPVWVFEHWLQGILRYTAGQEAQGQEQMFRLMTNPTLRYIQNYGALAPAKHYIWRSYVKGTSVDDGYKVADIEAIQVDAYLPKAPKPKDTKLTLFVRSTGGVSPRPLKMQKDDRGQWRITDEYSSLCVGLSKVPKDPKAGQF